MSAVTPTSVATVSTVRPGLVVPLALAGAFVANLGAHLVAAQIGSVQQGLAASAAGASWLVTWHAVAAFFAFAMAPLLVRTFGLRRLFLASTAVFALAAVAGALSTSLPQLLTTRVVQGFAGGMFGPIAFVAIFRAWSGPRLPLGFALLAFVLLVAANGAPAMAAPMAAAFGWQALLGVQVVLAALVLLAGVRWLPAGPMNPLGKPAEWVALFLLAIAAASLVVVFGQGARYDWFDSALIVGGVVLSVAAWIGFLLVQRFGDARVVVGAKLMDRKFGLPITLNFVSRAAIAATTSLLPLLFVLSGNEWPLHAAWWWLLLPQIAAFPLAWWLVHRIDKRVPMAFGLALAGLGIFLAGDATLPSLALIGIGQMLFLVPSLIVGAGSLKPEHGPTATIAFNMTTVGGATLGAGLSQQFATSLPAIDGTLSAMAAVLLLATFVVVWLGPTPPLNAAAFTKT